MAGALILNGHFQDCEGNPVAGGVLTLELNTVATDAATGTYQICPGEVVSYSLDATGSILGTQYVWANNLLSPSGTLYKMVVYSSKGQLSWGPNYLSLNGGVSGVIDLDNIVPNNPA